MRGIYSDFETEDNKTTKEWIAVLDQATRWDFVSVRKRAENRLSQIASSVDKITLAGAYDIPEWDLPSFTDLCARKEPLSKLEEERLGDQDVLRIKEVREVIRQSPCSFRMFPRVAVEALVKEKILGYVSETLKDDTKSAVPKLTENISK